MRNYAYTVLAVILILLMAPMNKLSAQIPCISGFVYDTDGNPVVDADLDFDDVVTGERIYTPGDNTDEFGFYRVCVLPGTYNISFAPPPYTHLLGRIFYNVTFSVNQDIELNVTLDGGVTLSGVITDSGGNPVGDVDMDADALSTGTRIFTPNDNSDTLTGQYWIVLPPDNYRIRYQPLRGTGLRGIQIDSLPVFEDTSINMVLEEGSLLSGMISNSSGSGLDQISVDLRVTGTGEKIYLANNKSDSTGYYIVAAPDGVFEFRFEPPFESRYVGVAVDSFEISGDIIYNQILQEGLFFDVLVQDSVGNPIALADLDFIQISSGAKIYTPYDKTDSLGSTTLTILPDLYLIRVDPPVGSFYDRLSVDSVSVQSDTSFVFVLQESERVSLSGKVTNSSGEGLADIKLGLISRTNGADIYIADNTTDSAGFYSVYVPLGSFDAKFSPPQGSRYVGLTLKDVQISQDTSWSDVVLDTGVVFIGHVYDRSGTPIYDADFDFVSEISGADILTPHDNTDSSGMAEMTVPVDSYHIIVAPPDGSTYQVKEMNSFMVESDTSYVFFLQNDSNNIPSSFSLAQNFPNPFNDVTVISYALFEASNTELNIYNILGQRVMKISNGYQLPGFYTIKWPGSDQYGNLLASGMYFYQLKTDYGDTVKKMVLLK
jgi:hypothetical protein